MKKQSASIIVFLLIVTGCSRISNDKMGDFKARHQYQTELSAMYQIDISSFFPESFNNPEKRGNCFGTYYYSSWDDSTCSIFRCCAVFNDEFSISKIDSLERLFKDCHITDTSRAIPIDICYLHRQTANALGKDSTYIPIYDMRISGFHLGQTDDYVLIGDEYVYNPKDILPEDLEMYVIDAKPGNFWFNKEGAEAEARPGLPKYWRHGYSKGFAVSRKFSQVCWWAIAW